MTNRAEVGAGSEDRSGDRSERQARSQDRGQVGDRLVRQVRGKVRETGQRWVRGQVNGQVGNRSGGLVSGQVK